MRKEEYSVNHLRVNKITPASGTQAATIADLDTDLEEAYETPELDTEAEIIVAINATNARVNEIATALNTLLSDLEDIGILASS